MNVRLGCHLSIAGGVSRAPERGREIGCTAFQIFTRNPRGWAFAPLDPEESARFRAETARGPFPVAHMPYLPNLAAPSEEVHGNSVKNLIVELERCRDLGIDHLVTHLGSHVGSGEENGRKRIVEAIRTAVDRAESETMVLMENTAGTKNSLGTTPAELAMILDALDGDPRVGICIDTAHAFAAGYDWRIEENPFCAELEKYGLADRVKVLHCNDSKVALGKKADRHAHIGLGEIGLKGLQRALNHPLFHELPIILETPVDEERGDRENIEAVRNLLES